METKPLALVIEDDKNLALAFAEAVEEADFEVEILYDGKTAMERLTETTPTLVVLDLHIPHIKGSKILEYIRSTERLENVRVVIASADDHRAAELRGIADLVLLKPIGFRQLQQLASRLRPN
jgi:DNA-binding response OmpR family regulator